MRSTLLVVVVVAVAAGSLVFTALPQATKPDQATRPARSLRGTQKETTSSSFTGLLLALGLGGAALGARASVARAAVLQKDGSGRFRFSAGGAESLVSAGGAASLVPPPDAAAALTYTSTYTGTGTFTAPWTKKVGATFPLCAEEAEMWDPLGFSSSKFSAAKLPEYRAAEIKHGRVAMVACTGLMVQHGFHLPYIIDGDRLLYLNKAPNGFAALNDPSASVGFGLIVMIAGFFEMAIFTDKGRSPGDFGDPLNLRQELAHSMDDARLKTCEIEHGRLAMLGFAGSWAAEYVTGYDAVQQWERAGEGAARLIKLTTMH